MTFAQLADGYVPLLILGAFLCGGFVKGAIGIGLPMVAMPILSLSLSVPEAIAITALPVLASNTWQAVVGGYLGRALWRFMPLIVTMTLFTFFTARLLHVISLRWLDVVLGVTLLAMVLFMFRAPRIAFAPRRESAVSAAVGVLAGLLGGLTSLSGVPVIMYLLALQLPKNEFVGSIAVNYFFGGLALAISLVHHQVLGAVEGTVSLAALVPMAAGMVLGERLRARLDPLVFRRAVLGVVAVVALVLLQRGLAQL